MKSKCFYHHKSFPCVECKILDLEIKSNTSREKRVWKKLRLFIKKVHEDVCLCEECECSIPKELEEFIREHFVEDLTFYK